jgi:hypothetical protein
MLAKIYGWFAEGFDTKDLQEARALLAGGDELEPVVATAGHAGGKHKEREGVLCWPSLLVAEYLRCYGMKFNPSGNGPAIGTSNSGPDPSGSMTETPSEAKNSAICC